MRILLLAQFFPPDIGGEEWHVFNLADTLAGQGHEVAVATQRMADVPPEMNTSSPKPWPGTPTGPARFLP